MCVTLSFLSLLQLCTIPWSKCGSRFSYWTFQLRSTVVQTTSCSGINPTDVPISYLRHTSLEYLQPSRMATESYVTWYFHMSVNTHIGVLTQNFECLLGQGRWPTRPWWACHRCPCSRPSGTASWSPSSFSPPSSCCCSSRTNSWRHLCPSFWSVNITRGQYIPSVGGFAQIPDCLSWRGVICANGCLRGPTGLTSDEADAPPPPPLTLMLPPPEVEFFSSSLHLRPSHNLSDESFWLVVYSRDDENHHHFHVKRLSLW